MTSGSIAAVDLGASSGRVMLARVGPNELDLRELYRFPNDPVTLPDGMHWDILRLYHEVLGGLLRSGREAPDILSVGIDSWGVDYGLLDQHRALVGNPWHYRDGRTERSVPAVHALVPPAELYERTGIQFLPFNTIYQLAAARGTSELAAARTVLLIPDLIGSWLSGIVVAEKTNVSTTGLLDAATRTWATDLMDRIGLPTTLFPDLRDPGNAVGPLRPEVRDATGLGHATVLTLVGSHDTASAVVAVPTDRADFAYVASGTWSLVGIELEAPVLTDASRAANFTNELGVDGRIRYLRNVTGLWLVEETLRTWDRAGSPEALPALLAAAAGLPSGGPIIDPNDARFLAAGDMPGRIADSCRRSDQAVPVSRPGLVRCILDSLAVTYARTIRDAERLSGRSVAVVHVVGGGSRNTLLCQLTADACQLPVVAGPVEATAIGNALVQARAHGLLRGGLDDLRRLVRATQELRHYAPRAALVAAGD